MATELDYMEYANDGAAQVAYIANDAGNMQCTSESTIKVQGSYSLKVVAAITDSLTDILSRIVGSPVDLSGIDKLYFGIYASRTGSNIKLEIKNQPVSAVKLILSFDGADTAVATTDRSQSGHTIGFNETAQLSTAQEKWGPTSLLLDGDSDYLNIADSADWEVSTDFTIDFWVHHSDHAGTECYICHFEDSSNNWNFQHTSGSGMQFRIREGGANIIDVPLGGEITDSNWHHIALCKVGSLYGIYVDGTQVSYLSDADMDTHIGDLVIGRYGTVGNYFDGHIDEVRIVHSNIFSAAPANAFGNGEDPDTITTPTSAHNSLTNTPNVAGANTWQGVEWDLSGVADADKDAIDRIIITVVNADAENTFYIDDFREGWQVLSHTLNLGLVPSQISTTYGGLLTLNLGLVPSFVLGPWRLVCTLNLGLVPSSPGAVVYGTLTKNLGLVPSHTSITYGGLLTLNLGLVPSSPGVVVYGTLTKNLGLVTIHISTVYKYSVELWFYNRSGTLVKIISSKSQNFPLIEPGLDFKFLRDGGCGPFNFTVSEDLGLEYNYRCDIYLYGTKWFSGYLTRLPQVGTGLTYRYEGWGFFEQIDWQTINETETGVELSVIAEDYLDTYITPNTDILKASS